MAPSSLFYLAILLSQCASSLGATKILQSNDDGWAVSNIRALNTALRDAGYNVVLSAPATDQSGTGSSDSPPTTVGKNGCEYNSCPAGSPSTGFNASDPTLNYVNSYPATSVRFGIQHAAPPFFNGTGPDLVVAGPNVGSNAGSTVLISGTVGASSEAAKEGFPSIAFSGSSGSEESYADLGETSKSATTAATVYAQLSLEFVQALLAKPFGTPGSSNALLPPNITLNVNFPEPKGSCAATPSLKFMLTRINKAAKGAPADVANPCGGDSEYLSLEDNVINESSTKAATCWATVSVMNATTKGDVDAATQAIVVERLGSFLC
ncbi:acid phosphatase [Schizopora paradoxa]|uniref:Acid phosphatase n=1 Tax=Schizopora paradoxa TaxID=27342 RepID=A0A0H2RAE5_9AGAM|nr:acid phosphatase [Schizopora paradoxa]